MKTTFEGMRERVRGTGVTPIPKVWYHLCYRYIYLGDREPYRSHCLPDLAPKPVPYVEDISRGQEEEICN